MTACPAQALQQPAYSDPSTPVTLLNSSMQNIISVLCAPLLQQLLILCYILSLLKASLLMQICPIAVSTHSGPLEMPTNPKCENTQINSKLLKG